MIAFHDELLDVQLLRVLGHASSGGSEIGECLAAAKRIDERSTESWRRAWTDLGERTASAAGVHPVSARAAHLRASTYFRQAALLELQRPLPPTALALYRRQRAEFRQAIDADVLAIPFEDTALHGYFFSGGSGVRPLVIAVGGYDSCAEESYLWNGVAANERGYHCLAFDGPGQGHALFEQGMPFRPDYSAVFRAVLDFACARDDVDLSRIVIIGESFGGYLGVSGACDPRVAACVLDPAQTNLFDAALARLPLPSSLKASLPNGPAWVVGVLRWLMRRIAKKPTAGWALRRGMLTHGVDDAWDYFVDTARYSNAAFIPEIVCPVLVCDARDDDIAMFARTFFEQLRCEKAYVAFEGNDGAGEHCSVGNRTLYHQRVFDWIDEVLAHRAVLKRAA